MMPRSAKYLIQRYFTLNPGFRKLQRSIEEAKILASKSLIGEMRRTGVVSDFAQIEFQVFSQFGEDGIIQYLLRHLPAVPKRFVEFGVGNYSESNTRFLLMNDNWSGMIMDGDRRNIELVRHEDYYWRNDLTAVEAFIDRDNIDEIIGRHGFGGKIGLLSIDLDGNDYWIWERVTVADPAIVVTEYNSIFGRERAVTIPYDRTFQRHRAHASGQYWGASLKAFCVMADRKGYAFVGSNSAGNNAFFVRKDILGNLKTFTAEEGYVASKFRDSRDAAGRLTFLGGRERLAAIGDLSVFDVESEKMIQIRELEAGE